MKIRNGFVTNSSSSSFIISVNDKKLTKREKLAIKLCLELFDNMCCYNETDKGVIIYNNKDLERLTHIVEDQNIDYSKYSEYENDLFLQEEIDDNEYRAMRYGGLYSCYHDSIKQALTENTYIAIKTIDYNDNLTKDILEKIKTIFREEVTVDEVC